MWRSVVADTIDDVSRPTTGNYALGQWLSGSTARAFRPTIDDLETAGYLVVKRDTVAQTGVTVLTGGELGALIDVCRAGIAGGRVADALRHIESRLRARLEQTRTQP